MNLPRGPKPKSGARLDVVCLGESSVDTVVRGGGLESGASKSRVSWIDELPGGQAATVAVGCARLGWRSGYAGVTGDDHIGGLIRSALEREGVDARIVTRAGARTRRAVLLVDAASGERRVFEHRDASLDLQPDEIDAAFFSDCRVLMVDASDVAASQQAAQMARAADVRTIVDVDGAPDGVHDLLREIDVIVLAAPAVPLLSGVKSIGKGLELIARDSGAEAVIVTLGAEGSLAYSQGQEVRALGRPVQAVDTTGAGDAFRAGFIASWLGRPASDLDLAGMLLDANLVASLNCLEIGAQTGLPRAGAVPAHLRGTTV